MSILEIKNKIVEEIDTIKDASLLKNILTYLENLKDKNLNAVAEEQLIYKKNANYSTENEIVAYTIKGEPISKEAYIKRNKQAVESYKQGNFKTQKELLEKYQKKA
ncbi:hypothetical protein [Polaribacter cellanae]|uniref:Uncharacterized protein n=1 Tax=Polaribacter cellanae TaxID=2818493 RepID=A0A975CLL7_9FLAO|nr:hypothetical protein [Polaribacter cellanae]QTE21475.1 hypothetical protein J3359_11645 [Polaribacter cellanae]